jgi:hypothetical protein
MKAEDVPGLRVVDLKEALKERGLSQTGVKAVLVERLLAALAEVRGQDLRPGSSTVALAQSVSSPVQQVPLLRSEQAP